MGMGFGWPHPVLRTADGLCKSLLIPMLTWPTTVFKKNGPCLAWSPRSMLGFTSALTWMTARMIQGTKLWIQQPLIVAWLKILLEKSVGIVAASLSGILSGNCCNLTWWKPKLLSIGSWRITVWNSSFNLSGSEAWAGKNGPPVHRARPNSCS